MTIKLIFNIILTIVIIYIFFIYNSEHLDNVSDTNIDKKITDAVTRIYTADVEAIRNLGTVAAKLNNGDKLDFPGQLNIKTKLATNDLNPSDMPVGWTGGIRFIDGYASGNMGFGPNATTINAQINKDGTIDGKKLTFIDGYASGNMGFGPNATTINAQIKQSGEIIGKDLTLSGNITLTNYIPTKSKWIISNTENNSDTKLSFTKMIGPTGPIGPILDLYENGDVNINGNLKVNTVLTKRNKARYIRVGNKMTPSTQIKNLDGSTNTDVSPLAIDNWHLIEIKVLSGGLNVANNATITAIGGITDNIKYESNTSYANITNGIIFKETQSDNISHGYMGGVGRHLLEIDLTREYDIDAIELYSRYNGDEARGMNGTIVELISSDKQTINRRIHTGLWLRTYSKEYILN